MLFNVHFDDQRHVEAWVGDKNWLWIFDHSWKSQAVADVTGLSQAVVSSIICGTYAISLDECQTQLKTGNAIE